MRQSEQIPTDNDWGEYWLDLDTAYAYQKFAGKSIADVQTFFHAPLIVSECISSMPVVPFQFYIFAFDIFLRSETLMTDFSTSLDGPDCSSTFLNLVRSKLLCQPDDILPIMHLFFLTLEKAKCTELRSSRARMLLTRSVSNFTVSSNFQLLKCKKSMPETYRKFVLSFRRCLY
jgi:hypothetical protein